MAKNTESRDRRRRDDDEDDDREERRSRSRRDDDEEDDRPSSRRKRDDDDEEERPSRKKGGGFHYQERSSESVQRRATQRGGMFDRITLEKYPTWRPKQGVNKIRILPPTWKQDDPHYALEIWLHRNVGPDRETYLCAKKMKGEKCVICDRRRTLEDPTEEELKVLKEKQAMLCWILDRKDEKAGAQLWTMPWTLDRDIAALSVNEETGQAEMIDHPDDGFDVQFTREGEKDRTKYVGVRIARNPSPILNSRRAQEELLEYITANPVPECLQYFDNEHIAQVFGGKSSRRDSDLDEDRPSARSRKRGDDDDEEEADERPSARRRREDDDEEEERPRKRRKREEDDDDEEADRPSSRRKRDDDEEEEEEEQPKERGRSKRTDPEDDEIPSERRGGKGRSRDDDDDEEEEEEPEDDRRSSKGDKETKGVKRERLSEEDSPSKQARDRLAGMSKRRK